MLKRFKTIHLALALVLAFALAAPALAAPDHPLTNADDATAYRPVRVAPNAALAAGEVTKARLNKNLVAPAAQTAYDCVAVDNQCNDPSLHLYWNYNMPSNDTITCGSFEAAFETFENPNFIAETLKTVTWFVYYDSDSASSVGTPDLKLWVVGDNGGLPDTTNILTTVSRPWGDWTTDGAIGSDYANEYAGWLPFDISGANVVIQPFKRYHVILEITNRWQQTRVLNKLYLFTDEADEDGLGCVGRPYHGGWLRNRNNYTGADTVLNVCGGQVHTFAYADDLYGPENWAVTVEHCAAYKPSVCSVTSEGCMDINDLANTLYLCFAMPSCCSARVGGAANFSGTVASSPCTLKTVSSFICDWTTTVYDTLGNITDNGTARDVDCIIYDGIGGNEVARVTLPGNIVETNWLAEQRSSWDFSSLNVVLPPGAVYYAAIVIDGAYQGDPGYRLAMAPGRDDPNCANAAEDYVLFVDTTVVPYDTSWGPLSGYFGGFVYQWDINVEVCCAASYFTDCTPAADGDWETQGNGIGRTNYSSASLSSLCGVNQAWSDEFNASVLQLQPTIAGDYVLVASTDSLHCLDKTTGAQNWVIGGFPYIVGNLRGAPTADLANDRVYFGGSGAQAFTCCQLSTGTVIWSRNVGLADPPNQSLNPGQTNWTPSVLAGGVIYFTQESGWLYALDAATGTNIYAPVAIPGAPGATPYNALASDGTKLWVGTANTLGSGGSLIQFDAATGAVDWQLTNPGAKFYPAADSLYLPEGFPGSLAYEDGVLYYHSMVRNPPDYPHYPQTGSVGAIDVATEDGTGIGILWVNDATVITVASPGTTPGTTGFSGPAIGPDMVYLNSRGFFSGTTEQDGVSAWHKLIGVRMWYQGYTKQGVAGGVPDLDDVRGESPVTVFCQADGSPYLFVGNMGGVWRLMDGRTGGILWERNFSGRVLGTALADDYVVVLVRDRALLDGTAPGSIVAFNVGADRPRLQLDTLFVFRTATPGDGLAAGNIAAALRNTGCADLTINAYGVVAPPAVRVSSVHPSLASSARRSTSNLTGYNTLLDKAPTAKQMRIDVLAGVQEGEEEASLVRTFANNATGAADPTFLAVTEAPGVVAPGANQSIAVTYNESGLTNNTGYTNYIEIDSDDPDYYPQDPSGADFGLPYITFQLFIGCPDAEAVMTTGAGEVWVNNFGADAGGGNFNDPGTQNFVVHGNDANMFDGGLALVVQDSVHWAFDGCSVGGYPRRAGEWGPTLPCGLTINSINVDSPLGVGADAIEEVGWNMLDLASTNGFFEPSSRNCGGVFLTMQRVASQDAAFGNFVLTAVNIENEPGDFGGSGYPDLSGTLNNLYYGGVTDWDISSNDNLKAFNDGYGQTNGVAIGWGNPAATWICGHARLDGDIVGAGPLGSGGAPTFMSADMIDDQGRGNRAFDMLSNPAPYGASVDPASTNNTDLAALWSLVHIPSLADGESFTFYYCIYQVQNGVDATWGTAAEADAAYKQVVCNAKAFAGFGKGDVNCDGCVDLADVVLLGNILDGLYDPTGTGGVYTADANGDNAYTQADYDLVYDVVAGVQPASAMANAWRF